MIACREGYANNHFARGMMLYIKHQKTLLYCAHSTCHNCGAQYAGPGDYSLQASGTPTGMGTCTDHSYAATSGPRTHPHPWGPQREDQPPVDTAGEDEDACFLRGSVMWMVVAAALPLPARLLEDSCMG